MIRLHYSVELDYQVDAPGADFIFALQPTYTRHQRVRREWLTLSQQLRPQAWTDPATGTRHLRVKAHGGPLRLSCGAVVDLDHHRAPSQDVAEIAVSDLPPQVLPWLLPSRYCESDRLHGMAVQLFGHLWQGHGRVQSIRDWVHAQVAFTSNSSNSSTSACDTLNSRQGVCRDFAHLMIALCRAVNIPARFVTGFDYGADPALGPPDFHAYVECYLGHRWYLFDPSGTAIPEGLVRLATSRDAADAAFATLFGPVRSMPPVISVVAVVDEPAGYRLPVRGFDALSTLGEAG